MAYRVIITPPAQRKLDDYVFYTLSILKNGDIAKSYCNTVLRLAFEKLRKITREINWAKTLCNL